MNEVTSAMSITAVELQYKVEANAAKCHVTTGIANEYVSIPTAPECMPQFTFTREGHPVHTEMTGPKMKTWPHHFPWTDSDSLE